MNLSITVYGRPQPQGSTRAFMPKGARFPIITTDNKNLKPWRQDIASQAVVLMAGAPIEEGPVQVACTFYFLKPKSERKAVVWKVTKPDIDKLLRSIFDALSGVCYRDDSQIVRCEAVKLFCESQERAEILVRSVGED